MNPQLIVALLIAGAAFTTGFGGAWKIQSLRLDARELQNAEHQLENERLVAKTRTRQDQAIIAAQSAGLVRARRVAMDADAVRLGNDRLRDDLAVTMRDAAASLDACTVRANTIGELFLAATESNRKLAAKADRHASDIQTLVEAWPK